VSNPSFKIGVSYPPQKVAVHTLTDMCSVLPWHKLSNHALQLKNNQYSYILVWASLMPLP
jgi:hypothetical protein